MNPEGQRLCNLYLVPISAASSKKSCRLQGLVRSSVNIVIISNPVARAKIKHDNTSIALEDNESSKLLKSTN